MPEAEIFSFGFELLKFFRNLFGVLTIIALIIFLPFGCYALFQEQFDRFYEFTNSPSGKHLMLNSGKVFWLYVLPTAVLFVAALCVIIVVADSISKKRRN